MCVGVVSLVVRLPTVPNNVSVYVTKCRANLWATIELQYSPVLSQLRTICTADEFTIVPSNFFSDNLVSYLKLASMTQSVLFQHLNDNSVPMLWVK